MSQASQDGYPYANFLPNAANNWPKFDPGADVNPREFPRCQLDYNKCFTEDGAPFANASAVFENIAFRHTQCGDCGESYTRFAMRAMLTAV